MCEYSITRLKVFTNLSLLEFSYRFTEKLVSQKRKLWKRETWKSGQDLNGRWTLKQREREDKLKYIYSFASHLSFDAESLQHPSRFTYFTSRMKSLWSSPVRVKVNDSSSGKIDMIVSPWLVCCIIDGEGLS